MNNVTYQFGSFKDEDFAIKLVEYLNRVHKEIGLIAKLEYNEYFKSNCLSISMPSDHSADYIIGYIDGVKHQHEGFLE